MDDEIFRSPVLTYEQHILLLGCHQENAGGYVLLQSSKILRLHHHQGFVPRKIPNVTFNGKTRYYNLEYHAPEDIHLTPTIPS